MKKIIVLGAGLYFKRTIQKLKEAGFYIIATDRNENAEGASVADEFHAIDISDKEATLKLAVQSGVHGIMNLNEAGSRTAGYVSNQLKLNGHSYETVEATNDKGLMRDIWRKHNLSIPFYRVVNDVPELRKAINEIGYPCILKPTDSGGSGRGISIIKEEADIEWAFEFAKPFVKNKRFIVEEFIGGMEMTIEAFSKNGIVFILAVSDKIKPDLRTRVATSLNYPALLENTVLAKVKKLVSDAVIALGIQNGISHTEVIVDGQGSPFLVETAARGGGGHIFHTIIEAVSGINAPVLQANWLVNDTDKITISSIKQQGCCYRFFSTPHGILKEIQHIDSAKSIDGVLDFGIVKKIGEEVGNLENSLQRPGFVVTKGKNREEAISVADKVEATLKFTVEK